MTNKIISLTVVSLLFACGEHKSNHQSAPVDTPHSNVQPAVPTPAPALDNKQYKAVKATFNGSYIGVVDGQLYNFDSEQKQGAPVQFVFANAADATKTLMGTLQRRPQRIDVLSADYVLLQRPQFQIYTNGENKTFEQDCFLIHIKTGEMWKFDEFFPVLNSFQTVISGNSKKLLFIGRKKADTSANSSWEGLDLRKDYNYAEGGWSTSLPISSPWVIVSVDFSDSNQVTLRPISSGVENIDSYLADSQGNVLAQTQGLMNVPSRTLAILQNEQAPKEATIFNVNITNYTNDSRVVVDSKRNFWRFSRQWVNSSYNVKAERLAMSLDLDNRPALLPLLTVSQDVVSSSYPRLDGQFFNTTFKGNEIFSFTGVLAVASSNGESFKVITDPKVQTGSLQQSYAALDTVNGKVLSYLLPYYGNTALPTLMEYDVSDLANAQASVYSPESKGIFGNPQKMASLPNGGIALETLDGPNANSYEFNGATGQYTLVKSVRMETDNRVRILVPVTTID